MNNEKCVVVYDVTFPVAMDANNPRCIDCPLLVDDIYNRNTKRSRCFKTFQIINDPNTVGSHCPIFSEED